MSSFIRSAADGIMPTTLRATDERGGDTAYATRTPRGRGQIPWEDGMLWPSARWMGGFQSMALADAGSDPGRWAPWTESAGNAGHKILSGTTRNAGGAALGGVTVQAVRQDGSSCDGTDTSDASGYYEIAVANPSGNYKVDAYLAGSPDVAGTTLNTLVPV